MATGQSDKIVIECECGSHLLQVVSDVEENAVPDIAHRYFIALFNYGYNNVTTWKHRLRVCWRVLTKGEPYDDQLVLTPDEAKKLADFINSTQPPHQ
jgi:hypothetical protein